VSETRDKRRRNDLDLFVLALIDSGISTPYDFQKAAGLSQGATIPALRRLLDARFIVEAKPGPRGRTDRKITAEGRRCLKRSWKDLIDDGPSGNLDADLRVALLALWVGDNRRLAVDFLRQSAVQRLESIGANEEPDQTASASQLAFWYRKLRSASAQALLKGESDATLGMANALPRSASGKPKPIRTKPGP
jgi:DNA-binding PadR family transcriptional regulator